MTTHVELTKHFKIHKPKSEFRNARGNYRLLLWITTTYATDDRRLVKFQHQNEMYLRNSSCTSSHWSGCAAILTISSNKSSLATTLLPSSSSLVESSAASSLSNIWKEIELGWEASNCEFYIRLTKKCHKGRTTATVADSGREWWLLAVFVVLCCF